MALGIIEPKSGEHPPGTEFLVDNEQTSVEHQYEHTHYKHGKGKVCIQSSAYNCAVSLTNIDYEYHSHPSAIRRSQRSLGE